MDFTLNIMDFIPKDHGFYPRNDCIFAETQCDLTGFGHQNDGGAGPLAISDAKTGA